MAHDGLKEKKPEKLIKLFTVKHLFCSKVVQDLNSLCSSFQRKCL